MIGIADHLRVGSWLGKGPGPRYVQLRKRIEGAIADGVLPPGSPLPSEREIATLTGLSRVTVRNAIQALAKAGVVVQRQGSGTFVSEPRKRVEQPLSHLTSFSEDMARRGVQVTSIWLGRGIFLPSPAETVALALAANASVTRLSRLRLADGLPMAIEYAALPVDILPDPATVSTSLYDTLDATGLRPVRAIQKISAINLSTDEAKHLGVADGAAGLNIERVSYLPSGRVVEFTRSIFRGDTYDFVAELRVQED